MINVEYCKLTMTEAVMPTHCMALMPARPWLRYLSKLLCFCPDCYYWQYSIVTIGNMFCRHQSSRTLVRMYGSKLLHAKGIAPLLPAHGFDLASVHGHAHVTIAIIESPRACCFVISIAGRQVVFSFTTKPLWPICAQLCDVNTYVLTPDVTIANSIHDVHQDP